MVVDRRGEVWTQREYVQLREAFAEGADLERLCELMGRSPYAVLQKLAMMNLLWVSRSGDYHRIDPDPWIINSVIRQMTRKDQGQ